MRAPQVAETIGKFKDAVREAPRRLDENAIGGRNQRDRLAPRDVPDARQISALKDGQLGDRDFLEIHRSKIAKGPVHAGARFIDPARRYNSGQRQLKKLVATVLCGSVDA